MIHRTGSTFFLATIITLGVGCQATPKREVESLQAANRNLSDQNNRLRGDLDACTRAREDAMRQLAAARSETDALRQQLASAPVVEEPAPGWTAVPGGAMIAIEENILFAPGRITLKPEALKTLDTVIGTLNSEYAAKDVFVFGHTDDQPIKKSGWDDNWQLSTERGLAVLRYLNQKGVSPNRMVACGAGEFRTRVQNNSVSNRQKNRRVEIFAVDPTLRVGGSAQP